jgi:3-hydroxyisobutyrate dehydrogenase-like beta-hydroxyacid dehydrogenase
MPNVRKTTAVAVIGLGNMGRAITDALLAKGHSVCVWNRTATKSELLTEAGARLTLSLVDAAQAADVLVFCVTDYPANMSILGANLQSEDLQGKTLVQLSTISTEESIALDAWAGERGASYLDGSILGFPRNLREGSSTIIFSGPRAVYDNCGDVIDALTRKPILVGEEPGTSVLADKMVYAQFYGVVHAYLQAAAMASAAGIPISVFRELTGSDESWLVKGETMRGFLDMIENHDYSDAGCALEVHAAAYDHVVGISTELGVGLHFSRMVADTMTQAIELGHGKHELAAIFEVLRSSGGTILNS